jgi:hypothetical protein
MLRVAMNGGSVAWIVRLAANASAAKTTLEDVQVKLATPR